MFEQVVLRRGINEQGDIDQGLLAETLLFYKDVLLLLDRGSLTALLKSIGPDTLLTLITDFGVKVSYLREGFGTLSVSENGIRMHDFSIFKVGGKSARSNARAEIAEVVERELGSSKEIKRIIRRLNDKIAIHKLNEREDTDNLLLGATNNDILDESFVRNGVERVLTSSVPGLILPRNWHFRAISLGEPKIASGYRLRNPFLIDTNLDFDEINRIFHCYVPPTVASFSSAYLVNHLFSARSDAYLASKYMAGYVSSPISSEIMKLRFTDLIRKRERDAQEIDLFQEIHLSEARKVREVINGSERSFSEFLAVLNKAERFKEWLAERSPDNTLIGEYHKAVTAETWIDKLPSKALRWVGTTALGAAVEALYPTGAAILAAQGVSVLDALFLDKMLRGWRPDQFVQGELRPFAMGSK